MYLPVALLLPIIACCTLVSGMSLGECPEVIETELASNLKDIFVGVWYDVYLWNVWGKKKSHCFGFEIVEVTPEEVEAVKEECKDSIVNFDWDNAYLKIVFLDDDNDPGRLISNKEGSPETYILQTCDFVSELEIHTVSGSEDVVVATNIYGAELLARQEPDPDQLHCLVSSIDIVQHYPWGIELCGLRKHKQYGRGKSERHGITF